MIKFILILLVISAVITSLLIIGEYFCRKFKGSIFSKWWRKNVIMEVDDHYPG